MTVGPPSHVGQEKVPTCIPLVGGKAFCAVLLLQACIPPLRVVPGLAENLCPLLMLLEHG